MTSILSFHDLASHHIFPNFFNSLQWPCTKGSRLLDTVSLTKTQFNLPQESSLPPRRDNLLSPSKNVSDANL